jgi:glutathione S-transferase
MREAEAVLVTIAFSHYCEKARWALDRAGVAYREEPYVPVIHLFGTVRRGGRSTPLLVRSDGKVLTDSTDILHHADAQRPASLYPADRGVREQVDALEDLFDEDLGPHTRRMAYHSLLRSGVSFAPTIRTTTTGVQRALAPLLGIIVPKLVERGLNVNAPAAERSRAKVEVVLGKVEELLADGRRYLVGDRFTAADLTFAALAAPLLSPPEQPVTSKLDAPASYLAMCDDYRRRPAGEFALRMYASERQST